MGKAQVDSAWRYAGLRRNSNWRSISAIQSKRRSISADPNSNWRPKIADAPNAGRLSAENHRGATKCGTANAGANRQRSAAAQKFRTTAPLINISPRQTSYKAARCGMRDERENERIGRASIPGLVPHGLQAKHHRGEHGDENDGAPGKDVPYSSIAILAHDVLVLGDED